MSNLYESIRPKSYPSQNFEIMQQKQLPTYRSSAVRINNIINAHNNRLVYVCTKGGRFVMTQCLMTLITGDPYITVIYFVEESAALVSLGWVKLC